MAAMAVLFLASCDKKADTPGPERLTPVKAGPGEAPPADLIKKEEARPTIHVKRNKDGSYSWEITGKDVNGILKADRTLRRSLKPSSSGGPED